MTPLSPPLDSSHVAVNKIHFQEARYQPEKVLEAQRNLWLSLGVTGASQKTASENFLIISESPSGMTTEQSVQKYSTLNSCSLTKNPV